MLTPHPGLPDFDYLKPKTLAEACLFLSQHPHDARLFLGGTDVFVRLRDGAWTTKYLVDVKGLERMNDITFDPAQGLTLGAAVNMNRVSASPEIKEHYPVLAQAAQTVASYQLRTRATLVGNICNASPAGDTIAASMVLQGSLLIQGLNGPRTVALSSFFLGPGKTVLEPGDIVTAIAFPIPPQDYAATYLKLGRNTLGDLALVGVAALAYRADEASSGYRFRLALSSVAPVPLIPAEAEAMLANNPINETTIEKAAEAAMEACRPIDDVRSGARYRRLMVRNLTHKAILQVWQELNGGRHVDPSDNGHH